MTSAALTIPPMSTSTAAATATRSHTRPPDALVSAVVNGVTGLLTRVVDGAGVLAVKASRSAELIRMSSLMSRLSGNTTLP